MAFDLANRLVRTGMPPEQARILSDAIGGGGAVTSVNGQTGAVVLDAADIGYTPTGALTATDVQGGIDELEATKT